MSEPEDSRRSPVRPLPFGGPHRGPALMWTERGARTGEEAGAPDPLDARVERLGPLLDALWRLIGLLALPLLLLHPRARRYILDLPAPEPGWIWLHGASAGEHVAARALAAALPPEVWRTSSSWRTPVPGAFPAPLDLPWVVERWLDRARPRLLVLVEGELWPGWLAGCRRRGIPVVVVNARAGRGTARLRARPLIWRWLTRGVRFIGQEETGDLKLSTQLRAATLELGRPTLVAGSTRPGDERAVLSAWALLPAPRPLLVLAPRHLDRASEVEGLALEMGVRIARRTRLGEAGLSVETEVLLLDTIGELAGLYRGAKAAFIGGTFDPDIGGHSPAEPFAAGLPVVHGPATHANPVAWTQGIALRVSGLDPEVLSRALRSALALGPRPPPQDEAAARCAAMLPEGRTPPEAPLHPRLRPLVPVWEILVRSSRDFAAEPERVEVPVVSVGALVAGGAARTPTAGWIAGQIPGAWVVARGYGRAGGDEVRVGLPGEAGSAEALGDELEMLRRRGIPVISAPDRVEGAREAARRGARLVVLDDGFQHRRLARDLDLVCVDARWPDGRGPIPVGWRREPWSALERAHWLWVSHGLPGLPPGADPLPEELRAAVPLLSTLPRVRARWEPTGWLHRGERLPLAARRGPARVFAGLARVEGFVCALLSLGVEIEALTVGPDHGSFHTVPPGAVMTEKDAARLPPDAEVWALCLAPRLVGEDRLLRRIRELLP